MSLLSLVRGGKKRWIRPMTNPEVVKMMPTIFAKVLDIRFRALSTRMAVPMVRSTAIKKRMRRFVIIDFSLSATSLLLERRAQRLLLCLYRLRRPSAVGGRLCMVDG